MRLVAGLVVAAAACVAGGPAGAEHEVSYRYTVLGYVKDAGGRAVAGQPVRVVRDKTGLAYAGETDAAGFFAVVLRLGDESAGESLTVEAAGAPRQLAARFDPRNQVDERGTRVDLEGARWVERPAWFHSTRTRALTPAAR